MLKLAFLSIIVVVITESAVIREDTSQCGYKSCHPLKEGFINVHIVPHTHDDVGWLKTVEQYYYGNNNTIQNAGVQYILDTVVQALSQDANKRFIYVETFFFWKWWIHQHDTVKSKVRKLVNNGQLEFISGAWTMNDEAATHYQSIIDNFACGLRKLNDSFGQCGRPKVGWQIDPFGHSREMASIFAQLGFDGLLLGRIDYQDKEERFTNKASEMLWQSSANLENNQLFTGVMFNTYAPPPGFCFDILCNDEQLIDDKSSILYNIDRRVDEFFTYLNKAAKVYPTNNLIITMGEDFHYQSAHNWYKNLDKLIYYANLRQVNGSKYNLIYSTPSCYVKSVQQAKPQLPLKSDDFFPYASDPNTFWTGYFVSRPTLKRFEREGNNFLQVCKQLYALTDLGPEDWVDLNALRSAMGIMQHHDAITGTEKQHVAEDYARILQEGFDECQIIVNAALSKLITGETNKDEPVPIIPIKSCLLANISSCALSETESAFVVTVYNPLSRPVDKYVRLPVTGDAYSVTDPDGKEIPVQLTPIPAQVLQIPGRNSTAKNDLVFFASEISALGFKSYHVAKKAGYKVEKEVELHQLKQDPVGFQIDPNTGLLVEVTLNGKTIPLTQQLEFYLGAVGDNREFKNRSSGAYIFRPVPGTESAALANKTSFKVFRGELFSEVQQVFNEWASQTIRVYANENFIEFDWLVGPIPADGVNGFEVLTKFKSQLKTNATFYTDSNGREMLKRVRDIRPTWKLNLTESISGNYYPITSKIVLVDEAEDVELAVLTDRAQGGTSLKDGELEIMIHRRCLHDDAFGAGEALNETAFGKGVVARGYHYLVIGPSKSVKSPSTAAIERDVAQRLILAPWIFVAPINGTFADYRAKFVTKFSGLSRALPNNVQILTLEPWKGFSFLLRLEHVLEKTEDLELSKPAIVDLNALFTPFEIVSIRETTLGGNQWLEDNDRLQFKSTELGSNTRSLKNNTKRAIVVEAIDNNLQVTLNPMQIRTFIIDIKNN